MSDSQDDLSNIRLLLEQQKLLKLNNTIDRYEVIDELGAGGMGKVYKAYDPNLERVVAVKLMSANVNREDYALRMNKEALATARLQHPHIVTIFDFGHSPLGSFIVMEYIKGENLESYLRTHFPLPESLYLDLFIKMAEALAYAHREEIIHRDLKPGNIMLENGEPKLVDFGLAKLMDASTTSSGVIAGTPHYMAPEQLGESRLINQKTDVYGLGALMYQVLTGEPPFKGTLLEIYQAIVKKKVIPPRRLNRKVSKEIEAICLKCLEKKPARRYQSMKPLLDDLKRYQAQRPILATNHSLWDISIKWLGRNQHFFLHLLLIVMFVGFSITLYTRHQKLEKQALQIKKKQASKHHDSQWLKLEALFQKISSWPQSNLSSDTIEKQLEEHDQTISSYQGILYQQWAWFLVKRSFLEHNKETQEKYLEQALKKFNHAIQLSPYDQSSYVFAYFAAAQHSDPKMREYQRQTQRKFLEILKTRGFEKK